MGFFQKFRDVLTKVDKSTNTDNSINTDNTTKINNSKHSKQVVKGNNNNFGTQNTITNNIANHFSEVYTEEDYNKIFILKMRWRHLIPHKIVKEENGIDSFNVLKPCEQDFLRTNDIIELTDNCNKYQGLYLRFRHNPTITNLAIKELKVDTDKTNFEINKQIDICGLLDVDKAVIINHKDLMEGIGTISITICYDKDGLRYQQNFEFQAKKDSKEFILRKFREPMIDESQELVGI